MNGDSIHNAIESANRKNISVSCTFRAARYSKPYALHELNVTGFFEILSTKFEKKDHWQWKVYWNSIKTVTVKSIAPNQIEYQTDYDGQVYTVNLFHKLRLRELPCFSQSMTVIWRWCKLSRDKRIDLFRLCASNICPSVHNSWFCYFHMIIGRRCKL